MKGGEFINKILQYRDSNPNFDNIDVEVESSYYNRFAILDIEFNKTSTLILYVESSVGLDDD